MERAPGSHHWAIGSLNGVARGVTGWGEGSNTFFQRQKELMAKNGNWTNCNSSSISANFIVSNKITLEVIEVCTN